MRVAIVGRPNVGKSTLFNRLAGKSLALVADEPGVTRDWREAPARIFDLEFTAIDTAGLVEGEEDSIGRRMQEQSRAALSGADVALFVVDAREGITPADEHFARWLRREMSLPIVLVANKCETGKAAAGVLDAFRLGLGEPVQVSAAHGEGLADLYAALGALAPDDEEGGETPAEGDPAAPLKLAIVGRPNAGKSTLINRLAGEERLLTGPEAGLTRDSIMVPLTWEGRAVELFDTAGERRRAKIGAPLEKMAVADGQRAVDFAEVVILLLDATLGLETQDLRIASRVLDEGRVLLVALNKWDVAEDQSRLFNGVKKALGDGLAQVRQVPLFAVSARTGKGLDTLLAVAFEARDRWSQRVSTGKLNRWLASALERNPPPAPKGKQIRLRYITQARTRPPTFAVFGSRIDLLPRSYERYLVNALADDLGLAGLPVRLHMRASRNPYDRSKGNRAD